MFAYPRLLTLAWMPMAIIAGIPIDNVLAQPEGYLPQKLAVTIEPDGSALVKYDVEILDNPATIPLFGGKLDSIAVTDLAGNNVAFEEKQGRVIVQSDSGVRISYSTPDLVELENTVLTLSISSPVELSVKIPEKRSIVGWGPTLPTKVDGDLIFPQGDVKLSYILGFAGTRDSADVMIRLARLSIDQIAAKHQGILLNEARNLLSQTESAGREGKFALAENLSSQATNSANATAAIYDSARQALEIARAVISNSASAGLDTSEAESILDAAEKEFQSGNYQNAKEMATKATSSTGKGNQSNILIFVAIAAGAGAVAAFFVLRKKPAVQKRPEKQQSFRPEPAVIAETETVQQKMDVAETGRIPDSVTDQSLLRQVVTKILQEKPHLRAEDRDVLEFLADNEGAVFESEIRTKFELPKTTVWRLVKRLEREDLIEIRKSGGQNLIKLRFEDHQT
ncbi:MAG: hypothetical protein DA330_03065 [Nitrososphaera sp.]|nr:hypothetical protein [Nitrososphaera sp.]